MAAPITWGTMEGNSTGRCMGDWFQRAIPRRNPPTVIDGGRLPEPTLKLNGSFEPKQLYGLAAARRFRPPRPGGMRGGPGVCRGPCVTGRIPHPSREIIRATNPRPVQLKLQHKTRISRMGRRGRGNVTFPPGGRLVYTGAIRNSLRFPKRPPE